MAHAELPSIRCDRLRPLGGSAGTIINAEIAGAEIDEMKQLLFDHPGLSAEFVEERKFKISVAAGQSLQREQRFAAPGGPYSGDAQRARRDNAPAVAG